MDVIRRGVPGRVAWGEDALRAAPKDLVGYTSPLSPVPRTLYNSQFRFSIWDLRLNMRKHDPCCSKNVLYVDVTWVEQMIVIVKTKPAVRTPMEWNHDVQVSSFVQIMSNISQI